jgi:hypothetical protein
VGKYLTKQFSVYVGRWILSAFVMMPPLWFFSKIIENNYINLLLVQIIGAFIFYRIDEYIFVKVNNGK